MGWVVVVVGQPITDLISGPIFDFTFTIGPELDNKSPPLRLGHRSDTQSNTLNLCTSRAASSQLKIKSHSREILRRKVCIYPFQVNSTASYWCASRLGDY